MRARVTALNLRRVVPLCLGVWSVRGREMQMIGDAVFVIVVIVPCEGMQVSRHG